VLVQTFVPEPAVEAFDPAVLHRFSRRNVVRGAEGWLLTDAVEKVFFGRRLENLRDVHGSQHFWAEGVAETSRSRSRGRWRSEATPPAPFTGRIEFWRENQALKDFDFFDSIDPRATSPIYLTHIRPLRFALKRGQRRRIRCPHISLPTR